MIEFYPNSIYYPRESVEAKLAKGELEKTKQRLFGWVERHCDEIWECAKDDAKNPTNEILLDNLRALLLCKGSLQPAAEMGDLIHEIKKESWFRNEHEKETIEEVEDEWCEKYLIKWREARMFEAFVLIDKYSEQLLSLLKKH